MNGVEIGAVLLTGGYEMDPLINLCESACFAAKAGRYCPAAGFPPANSSLVLWGAPRATSSWRDRRRLGQPEFLKKIIIFFEIEWRGGEVR
jgi:hypothetical protein